MSKKSPQLRFEGFTDDWEERKLGELGAQCHLPLQNLTDTHIGGQHAETGGNALSCLTPLVPTNETVDKVNEVFSLNLKAFSPPEVDRENISGSPENPLFTINSCHQELTDTICRIGNRITEWTIGVNGLVNETKG